MPEQSQHKTEDLQQRWWEAPVIEPADDGYDDDIRAINAVQPEIAAIPRWALQLRDAMPKWGFEMCAHRWLDGLGHILHSIGEGTYSTSLAGHCGDVPGQIVAAAEQRAGAVEEWITGRQPRSALAGDIAARLGQTSETKKETARCFVDLVRSDLFGQLARDEWLGLVDAWKSRAQDNLLLKEMLGEHGLPETLENSCGFKFVEKLDIYIELLGGDRSREKERIYNCNSQLRFIWRDDPSRYTVAQGYLWGMYAYLGHHDELWIRAHKPGNAGASLFALQSLRPGVGQEPLKRWLTASLLKSTEIWCQRAIRQSKGMAPDWALDLPMVSEVL